MTCEVYVLDHFRPILYISYKDHLKLYLKDALSEDDYSEFIEGLTDFDLYEEMDEELKVFIQAYYNEDIPLHTLIEKEEDERLVHEV